MKGFRTIITGLVGLFLFATTSAIQVPGPDSTIYNQEISNIIDTTNLDNPIREGAYMIINDGNGTEQNVRGILDIGEIQTHDEAQNNLLNIIKNIINYALGALSFVALVYLIYHGILMVTAAGDDEQYKKGLKGLKYAAIAIVGIGVSRFVISFVFYLLRLIISGDPNTV